MDKQTMIQKIEDLFPADSPYLTTQKVGIELLKRAKRNMEDWRNLPEKVLFEYLRLCREKENRIGEKHEH